MLQLRRIKFLLLLVAFLGCVATAWVEAGSQQKTQSTNSLNGLTAAERRGKLIYLNGEDGVRVEITARLGRNETELPATAFACANCHGLTGEGTNEGGLISPPITPEALAASHTSGLTGLERGPYDVTTTIRSIRDGLDASGGRMHPGMPLYQMSADQMADLIAYMKKLGGEIDPGLSETTIKVGAALPLTGALASIGEDVRNALAASFAEVNDQGGVYGRRIELIVEDSRGDPAGTLEATRRLIEDKGAFALVGSFEPKGSEAANELIQRSEIPLIGPVTLSPRAVIPPNRYVFYLLPTFRDQARALVDFVESLRHSAESADQTPSVPGSKARGARLAVIYADGELEADAVSGLRVQAKLNRLEIVAEQRYEVGRFSPAKAVETLSPKQPDFVFFFGAATEFTAFAREMKQAGLTAALLTSVVMLGREAFNLPPAVVAQTYLSYPAALPQKEEFASFLNTMRRSNVELRSPAFQTVAYAAAQAFIEAAKQSTRRLNRPTLISSLEGLKDYQTGVVPPLSFGPNRRVGSTGSYVVGIDLQKRQYIPLGEQLTPKETR